MSILLDLVCLVLFRKVLRDSNILSEMLQSKSVDHSKAVELIDALKETLTNDRSEAFLKTYGQKHLRRVKRVTFQQHFTSESGQNR